MTARELVDFILDNPDLLKSDEEIVIDTTKEDCLYIDQISVEKYKDNLFLSLLTD